MLQSIELTLHYYKEGFLIRSTIDTKKYGLNNSNYVVPITIVANKTFGVKVIQGVYIYVVNHSITYHSHLFDQGILMMNAKNNWLIFIPSIDNYKEKIAATIVKELEAELKEKFSIHSLQMNSLQP